MAPLDLYKRISASSTYPVYIDDNIRLDYPEGAVLNGSINAEQLGYPNKLGIATYLLDQSISHFGKIWQGEKNN